jgi:hypothetical protein
VYLDLAPFIVLARDRLSQAGLTAVDLVPDIHPMVRWRRWTPWSVRSPRFTTLDTVVRVLP